MRSRKWALIGALVAVWAGTVLGAARPAAAAPTHDPAPAFECAFKVSDGVYITVWGYDNETGHTQSWGIGPHNRFTPRPSNRGQPVTFLPGRHDNVVTVPWDGRADLAWHIDKTSVSAATSPVCSSNPVPITGTGLSAITAVFVLALVAFGVNWVVRRRGRPVEKP